MEKMHVCLKGVTVIWYQSFAGGVWAMFVVCNQLREFLTATQTLQYGLDYGFVFGVLCLLL
jgi:hypothetical protein